MEAAFRKARDLSAAGGGALRDHQGPWICPGGERRAGEDARHQPAGSPVGDLDRRLRRRDGLDRGGPAGRGGAQRGDGRADGPAAVRGCLSRPGLRPRHRRAAHGHLGRRDGDRRPAPGGLCLLDVPEPRLRPVADGRGAAPAAGDLRPGPGRHHRQRRTVPPRHVGPDAARHRSGRTRRRTPRRHPTLRVAARGGGLGGWTDGAAVPEGIGGASDSGRRSDRRRRRAAGRCVSGRTHRGDRTAGRCRAGGGRHVGDIGWHRRSPW